MKKWHLPFLLCLIVGTVIIWRQNHPTEVPYQKEEGYIFGTSFHATYQYDKSLKEEIMKELNAVDASLSMFNKQSTITKLNNNQTQQTDSLFLQVFHLSQQVSKATNGAFDITVGPLVNAWGFGFKNEQLPDSSQVDSLRNFIGWQKVCIDDNGLLHKKDNRMVLDCSAVAKGFGVDRVADMFRRYGIKNFMIEVGGEIVLNGKNDKGNPWTIEIKKPTEDNEQEGQAIVRLTEGALATSGNYRNFYITEDGRKLAHTIDPRTGYPVQHSVLSASVLAPTCAMADAFATSFMVMGLEEAKQTLNAHEELNAYLIYADEKGAIRVWQSPEWPTDN